MRSMRDTSLLAYNTAAPKLARMEMKVYFTIAANPDCTALELADKLGLKDPNHVRPRITELVNKKVVKSTGKRPCTISLNHRPAHVWRVI